MNHPNLARYMECTGCMACVDVCPKNALKGEINVEGHFVPICDTDKCVLCHSCEKTCPPLTLYPYRCVGKAFFYAAWNNDINERKKSASGGAFSAIATYVINNGGYVVGAANLGICDIKHIIINIIADLAKLQGSKYTQSDAEGSYKETFKLLKAGNTVLYSGTGCQVAGLFSFIGKKKYAGKLITVDLICGGVPSKLLIDKFVVNEPYDVKRIITFRTKEKGWKSNGFAYNMKVEDVKGIVHDYTGNKNLVTDGFSCEMTDRYSCYDCKFNGRHRMSDFTIGDLWGDTEHKEQHYDGLSLVIAHNDEAIDFLNHIKNYLHTEPVDGEEAVAHNPRIDKGKNVTGRLFERKHLAWIFDNLGYKTLRHIYANANPWYSPWVIYSVTRKIRIKILKVLYN